MFRVLTAIAWLAVGLALYVTASNYAFAITSFRNKRRGIDRHISMVPLVSLALCSLAFGISFVAAPPVPSRLLVVATAGLDPSLWTLIAFPFVAVFRRGRS